MSSDEVSPGPETSAAPPSAPVAPRAPWPWLAMVATFVGLVGLPALSVLAMSVEPLAWYRAVPSSLAPWIAGALVVELVAAAIPRLRAARLDDDGVGRRNLQIAGFVVGLLVSAGSAFTMHLTLVRIGEPSFPLFPFAASVAAFAFAHLLGRAALVGGFSLVLGGFAMHEVVMSLSLVPIGVGQGDVGFVDAMVALLPLAATVCAAVFIVSPTGDRPSDLPRPLGGVIAVSWAVAATEGLLEVMPNVGLLIAGWIAGVVALLLSAAFFAPSRVARVWASVGFSGDARASFLSALPVAVLLCAGLAALEFLKPTIPDLAGTPIVLESFSAVIATVVLRDIVGELRFRRAHGAVVAVRTVHRMAMLGPLLDRLARGGIPAHARGACHRALWHGFGPFLPVHIVVPAARADDARRIARGEGRAVG